MSHSHEVIFILTIPYVACLIKIAVDSARGILGTPQEPENYWSNAAFCLICLGFLPISLIARLFDVTAPFVIAFLTPFVLPLMGVYPAVIAGLILKSIHSHWISIRVSSTTGF